MDSRQRLIDSTRDLLWERGYVGTSPKAIQQRSGVGQGSMYHHFAAKSLLAAAALTETARTLCENTEAALTGPGSPLTLLCDYLLRPREVLRGCRIGRMAHDPDVVLDPLLREPVRAGLARQHELLTDVFTRARAFGELAQTADPELLATVLLAVVQGGYALARAEDSPEPFYRAIRGFLTMLAPHAPHGLPEVVRTQPAR